MAVNFYHMHEGKREGKEALGAQQVDKDAGGRLLSLTTRDRCPKHPQGENQLT